MKRIIKKCIGIVLSMCIIWSMCITTYASEYPNNLGVVDGSVLTNENSSESIFYNPSRGNILNRGVAKISNNGNGSVNAYGAVMPAVKCDKLRLEMTIQRLVGGSWANVKSFSDVAYNASLLSKSYNYSVTGGYYYRLKVACIATKGGTTETQMPITDGIWID